MAAGEGWMNGRKVTPPAHRVSTNALDGFGAAGWVRPKREVLRLATSLARHCAGALYAARQRGTARERISGRRRCIFYRRSLTQCRRIDYPELDDFRRTHASEDVHETTSHPGGRPGAGPRHLRSVRTCGRPAG